ncbi:hypothetical protein EDC39_10986 [Geothermobacter ehrlichii]|uniref:Glycosyltransferase n=2 Tax=Geothermobacter ehrlichii TaxID=213224 RepID=A0A5D3WIH1_9BACT|nr:hypothetical protein EDC39_10986 [Geothermobacter ehrlichii]
MVKTRLCPPLTPRQAADFYRVCLLETLRRVGRAGRRLVLFYAGCRDWFAEHCPGCELRPQVEGDLGRRMAAALDSLLESGAGAAALIGTDSPDLPLPLIDRAFAALAAHDAVTIPADDGGYVLIGCRRPCPQLFADIPWSSDQVLALTRRRATDAGLSYTEIDCWQDLDDAAALCRLLARSPDGEAARYLRRIRPDLA